MAPSECAALLTPPALLPPLIQVVHGPELADDNSQSLSELAVKGFQRPGRFVGHRQPFRLEEFGSECVNQWL